MEFDEMKKIWDSQNNEPFYVINEGALHNHILSKKKQGHRITNITEVLLIIVNAGAACLLFGVNLFSSHPAIAMYILSAWMFSTALYVVVSRMRRIKANSRFDRSMRGELMHAIYVATYQVRLSLLGRWNILPMAILILIGTWGSGKSIGLTIGMVVLFIVTNYAAGWEHNIYKSRKRSLEVLQNKLVADIPDDHRQ